MRLYGIELESIVDGPGIRVALFAQGCESACPNCHNEESWPRDGGREYTPREVMRLMKKPGPGRKKIKGVTFSGGEPFLQAADFALVAFEAHRMGWDVVTYTGYKYEDLAANPDSEVQALLKFTDILIDGPYIHERRAIDLKFRGSDNQRLIDMNETRKRGRVVLFF